MYGKQLLLGLYLLSLPLAGIIVRNGELRCSGCLAHNPRCWNCMNSIGDKRSKILDMQSSVCGEDTRIILNREGGTNMELNKELLTKAKAAKDRRGDHGACQGKRHGADGGKREGVSLDLLHPQTGELSDDESDNVAGGGCHNGGRLVVSAMHYCDEWRCKDDGSQWVIDGMLECYKDLPGSPHSAIHVSIVPTKKGCGSAITPLT